MTPGTILLIAANLLPLAGVLFWGWDVFVLLILYWLETVVIGFWAIVDILLGPDGSAPSAGQSRAVRPGRTTPGFAGRLALAAFITVHAGIFMAGHFFFLWVLFAGPWAERIRTVWGFWDQLIIGSDLWAPLLFLFVVRGWQVFAPRIGRAWGVVPTGADAPAAQGIPAGLYIRIIVMQVTIIFGGWLALTLGGSIGALVLLVGLKTGVDFLLDPLSQRPAVAKPGTVP